MLANVTRSTSKAAPALVSISEKLKCNNMILDLEKKKK